MVRGIKRVTHPDFPDPVDKLFQTEGIAQIDTATAKQLANDLLSECNQMHPTSIVSDNGKRGHVPCEDHLEGLVTTYRIK
jgi:hypothetical protein